MVMMMMENVGNDGVGDDEDDKEDDDDDDDDDDNDDGEDNDDANDRRRKNDYPALRCTGNCYQSCRRESLLVTTKPKPARRAEQTMGKLWRMTKSL